MGAIHWGVGEKEANGCSIGGNIDDIAKALPSFDWATYRKTTSEKL